MSEDIDRPVKVGFPSCFRHKVQNQLVLTMKNFKLLPNWAYPCAAALIIMTMTLNAGCDSSVIPDASSEEEITSTHHTPAISFPEIVNGRMDFDDFEDFGSYISGIANVAVSSNDRPPSPLGFRSLLEDTEQLISRVEDALDTGEPDLKLFPISEFEIVEDPYLASVLNVDGEVQIGDDVFKFTRNYVYHASAANAALLKSVPLRQPDHLASLEFHDGNFRTHEIKRSTQTYGASESGKTMSSSTSCEDHFIQNSRRIRGSSWITSYGNYASAGSWTHSERKAGIWGWVSNIIDEIALVGMFDLRNSLGERVSGTKIFNLSNNSLVGQVYIQDYGLNASVTGWLTGEHGGRRISTWKGCMTGMTAQ